jgi:hypothetical protein
MGLTLCKQQPFFFRVQHADTAIVLAGKPHFFDGILCRLSYCQELCMEGSRGVLCNTEAVLEDDAVHDLR